MDEARKGQISARAAEIYEDFFVPALFAQWAPKVIDRAGLGVGDSFLDVACGTGILAREAKEIVGDTGRVVGLDCNRGMLGVAERTGDGIEWRVGAAEEIPFADGEFTSVASQFGLMFFDEPVEALRQMRRKAQADGSVVVAVWDCLDNTPGYRAMVDLLDRLFGTKIASALTAPYCMGDQSLLERLFDRAGMADARIEQLAGEARFPSITAWVETDVFGWTLAGMLDDEEYKHLLSVATTALSAFENADGSVQFEHSAFIISHRA